MKPGGKQNTVGNQYNNLPKTINRFLPLEDEYDRESTLQEDFRLEKGSFEIRYKCDKTPSTDKTISQT